MSEVTHITPVPRTNQTAATTSADVCIYLYAEFHPQSPRIKFRARGAVFIFRRWSLLKTRSGRLATCRTRQNSEPCERKRRRISSMPPWHLQDQPYKGMLFLTLLFVIAPHKRFEGELPKLTCFFFGNYVENIVCAERRFLIYVTSPFEL